MTYPDIEADGCGYRAQIVYDRGACGVLHLSGLHQSFSAARDRARSVAAAMRGAGEMGVAGWVACLGERPAGFPRNGVPA
jgi:hypothetical protein